MNCAYTAENPIQCIVRCKTKMDIMFTRECSTKYLKAQVKLEKELRNKIMKEKKNA